jgi:hypothetical protein
MGVKQDLPTRTKKAEKFIKGFTHESDCNFQVGIKTNEVFMILLAPLPMMFIY